MPQYIVKPGESWASIAGKVGGNQRLMEQLARANYNRNLQPGKSIWIPDDFGKDKNPLVTSEWIAQQNTKRLGWGKDTGYMATYDQLKAGQKDITPSNAMFYDWSTKQMYGGGAFNGPAFGTTTKLASPPKYLTPELASESQQKAFDWETLKIPGQEGMTPDQITQIKDYYKRLNTLETQDWGTVESTIKKGGINWKDVPLPTRKRVVSNPKFDISKLPGEMYQQVLPDYMDYMWKSGQTQLWYDPRTWGDKSKLPALQPIIYSLMSRPSTAPLAQGAIPIVMGAASRSPALIGLGVANIIAGYASQWDNAPAAQKMGMAFANALMYASIKVEQVQALSDPYELGAGMLQSTRETQAKTPSGIDYLLSPKRKEIDVKVSAEQREFEAKKKKDIDEAKASGAIVSKDGQIADPLAMTALITKYELGLVQLNNLTQKEKDAVGVWESGKAYYETQGALTPGIGRKPGEIWLLGMKQPVKVPDGYTLDDYSDRIVAGESPEQVYMDYMTRFGVTGVGTDLVLSSVFDPLNLLGEGAKLGTEAIVKRKLGQAVAKGDAKGVKILTGMKAALGVVTEVGPSDVIRMAVAKKTGKGVFGGNSFLVAFRDMIRNGELGMKDEFTGNDAWSRLARTVAGFDAEGLNELKANPNQRGLMAWLGRLTDLAAPAKAREALKITLDNFKVILDNAGLDVDQVVKMYRMWSKADIKTMRDEGMNWLGSPESSTVVPFIRTFDKEAEAMTTAYSATADGRLRTMQMAEVLGVDPNEIITQYKNGKGAELWTKFSAMLNKLSTPEAKDLQAEITRGTFNNKAFTESIDPFMQGNAALTPGEFRATFLAKLSDTAAKEIADYYHLAPDSKFFQFASALKSAQGLLLLQFSPSYVINNGLTNRVTMAYDHIGFTPDNAINDWLDRFGYKPERFGEGYVPTSEELNLPGERNFIRLTRPTGIIGRVQNMMHQVGNTVGWAGILARKMEEADSRQAYFSGMRRMWGRTWIPGIGFDTMSKGLTDQLGRLNPNIGRAIYSAIQAGMNWREVEANIARLSQGAYEANVHTYIDSYAKKSGQSVSDVTDMLASAGILDELRDKIRRAKTPQQRVEALNSITRKAQDWADRQTALWIEHSTEEAQNIAKAEGFPGTINLFAELHAKKTKVEFETDKIWIDAYDEVAKADSQSVRNSIIRQARNQVRSEYGRMFALEAASLEGIARGLDIESGMSRMILEAKGNEHDLWRGFHEYADAERDRFFGSEYPSREARDAAYKAMEEDLNDKHAEIWKQVLDEREKIASALEMHFETSYGEGMGRGAREWQRSLVRIDDEMRQMMTEFRKSLEGNPPDEFGGDFGAWRRAMWDAFLPEYQAKYLESLDTEYEGLRKLYRAGGEEPPVMPPPPEPTARPPESGGEAIMPPGTPPEPTSPAAEAQATEKVIRSQEIEDIRSDPEMAFEGDILSLSKYPADSGTVIAAYDRFIEKYAPDLWERGVRFDNISPDDLRRVLSTRAAEKAYESANKPMPTPTRLEQVPLNVHQYLNFEGMLKEVNDIDSSAGTPIMDADGNVIGRSASMTAQWVQDFTKPKGKGGLGYKADQIREALANLIVGQEIKGKRIYSDLVSHAWETLAASDFTNFPEIASAMKLKVDWTRNLREVLKDYNDRLQILPLYDPKDRLDILRSMADHEELFAEVSDVASKSGKDLAELDPQAFENYNAVLDRFAQTYEQTRIDVQKEEIAIHREKWKEEVAAMKVRGDWQISAEALREMARDVLGITPEHIDAVVQIWKALAKGASRYGLSQENFYNLIGGVAASRSFDSAVGGIEGRLMQATDTLWEMPPFRNWFGDSKIVGENNKPLTVFHGTIKSFDTFDPNAISASDKGFYGKGYYFSPHAEMASDYAIRDYGKGIEPGGNVLPVYLRIENPYKVWDQTLLRHFGDTPAEITMNLKKAGYDGVMRYGGRDGNTLMEVVAFEPNQIKSVFNRGTFDLNDNRILHQGIGLQTLATPNKKMLDQAKKYFGTNENSTHGFLAPDGKILPVQEEHSEIYIAVDNLGENAIDEFINETGAIRLFVSDEEISLALAHFPTTEQIKTIREIVNNNQDFAKKVFIDIQDGKRYTSFGFDANPIELSRALQSLRQGTYTGNKGILYQEAFHGGHRFNKFDMDHLGTGTGGQMQGWGLYFADERGVGKYYYDLVAKQYKGKIKSMTVDGVDFDTYDPRLSVKDQAVVNDLFWTAKFDKLKDFSSIIEAIKKEYPSGGQIDHELRSSTLRHFDQSRYNWADQGNIDYRNPEYRYTAKDVLRVLDEHEFKIVSDDDAQLYKVDIKIPDESYLVLDLPVEQQSRAVQNALYAMEEEISAKGRNLEWDEVENGVSPQPQNIKFKKETFFVAKDGNGRQLAYMIEITPDGEYRFLDHYANEGQFKTLDQAKEFANEYIRTHEGKPDFAKLNGHEAYRVLADELGSDKKASLYLKENGILGNKYLDQQSRPTSAYDRSVLDAYIKYGGDVDKTIADIRDWLKRSGQLSEKQIDSTLNITRGRLEKGYTYNYVVFDENSVEIVETYYQSGKKGAAQLLDDGSTLIHLFENADVSTLVHETAHVIRRYINGDDLAILEQWAEVQNGKWERVHEEKFARGFERYLAEGVAPTPALVRVFEQFKNWLIEIYRSITGSAIDVELTDEVRAVFDRLLDEDAQKNVPDMSPEVEQIYKNMGEASQPEKIRPPKAVLVDTVGFLGTDGKLYSATGRQVVEPPMIRTRSDRVIANDIKKQNMWLVDQARQEADARGDTWNGDQFRRMQLQGTNNLTPAEKDLAHEYLFGTTEDVYLVGRKERLRISNFGNVGNLSPEELSQAFTVKNIGMGKEIEGGGGFYEYEGGRQYRNINPNEEIWEFSDKSWGEESGGWSVSLPPGATEVDAFAALHKYWSKTGEIGDFPSTTGREVLNLKPLTKEKLKARTELKPYESSIGPPETEFGEDGIRSQPTETLDIGNKRYEIEEDIGQDRNGNWHVANHDARKFGDYSGHGGPLGDSSFPTKEAALWYGLYNSRRFFGQLGELDAIRRIDQELLHYEGAVNTDAIINAWLDQTEVTEGKAKGPIAGLRVNDKGDVTHVRIGYDASWHKVEDVVVGSRLKKGDYVTWNDKTMVVDSDPDPKGRVTVIDPTGMESPIEVSKASLEEIPTNVVPMDDWQGTLIKARDYAVKLGIADQVQKVWNDQKELVLAIRMYLEMKEISPIPGTKLTPDKRIPIGTSVEWQGKKWNTLMHEAGDQTVDIYDPNDLNQKPFHVRVEKLTALPVEAPKWADHNEYEPIARPLPPPPEAPTTSGSGFLPGMENIPDREGNVPLFGIQEGAEGRIPDMLATEAAQNIRSDYDVAKESFVFRGESYKKGDIVEISGERHVIDGVNDRGHIVMDNRNATIAPGKITNKDLSFKRIATAQELTDAQRLTTERDFILPDRDKRLFNDLSDRIDREEFFNKSKDFEDFIKERGFNLMDENELNLAYDLLEGAFNLKARKIRENFKGAPLVTRLGVLDALEQRLTEARRTLAKKAAQQFSTPLTISEAAGDVADIRPGDVVGEPTAGNANLVERFYGMDDVMVRVNEFDAGRRKVLSMLGYEPTALDLMKAEWVIQGGRKAGPFASVILANPPWGSYATGKYGKAVNVPVNMNDWSQRFTYLTLMRLPDGGRFVGVMPTNWLFTMDRVTRQITVKPSEFYNWLKRTYNVIAVIESPEGAYKARGTDVGSLLVVVDKTPPTDATVERFGKSRPDGWNEYASVINALPKRKAQEVINAQGALKPIIAGPLNTGITDPNALLGVEHASPGRIGKPLAGTVQGTNIAGGIDAGVEGVIPVPERTGVGVGIGELGGAGRPGEETISPKMVEAEQQKVSREPFSYSEGFVSRLAKSKTAVSNSRFFAEYVARSPVRPDDIIHPHPEIVVETKSLAGVAAPVLEANYRPSKTVMDAMARRVLSINGNVDPIWQAIQMNDKYHMGALVADDVGTGKSRTAAGFAIDRIEKGKKRLLVITDGENNVLNLMNEEFPRVYSDTANETGGYLSDTAPKSFPAKRIFLDGKNFPKVKKGLEEIPTFNEATVYFVKSTELYAFKDQIKRLHPDVVIADEVHEFKNADSGKNVAWTELHKDTFLPDKADFLYLSATPGKDLAELQYLYGLRVWSVDGFSDWIKVITGQESPEKLKLRQQARDRVNVWIARLDEIKNGLDIQEVQLKDGTPAKQIGNVVFFQEEEYFRFGSKEVGAYYSGDWREKIRTETEAAIIASFMDQSIPRDLTVDPNGQVVGQAFRDAKYKLNDMKPTKADLGEVDIKEASDIINKKDKGGWGKTNVKEVTLPPAHTEQIMRELKVNGSYMSRDISRAGVEFDVKVIPPTSERVVKYNQRVELYKRIHAAFMRYGKMDEGPKKYAATFGISGDLQQDSKRAFFDMRLPDVVRSAKEAIARGEKVVIAINSVGEVTGEKGPLVSAINKINTHQRKKIGDGMFTDPTEIPEALVEVMELRDAVKDLEHLPSPIDYFRQEFGDHVDFIVGEVSTKERRETIYNFQHDKLDVVIISDAGKQGINLHDITGKHRVHMIYADPDWSPENFKQALGRIDRTGQKSSPFITFITGGSAGEMRFTMTIANRMKGLGATSKGGAESTGVGALTDAYDLGTSMDRIAMAEAWRILPEEDRSLFLDKFFYDKSVEGVTRSTLDTDTNTWIKFMRAFQSMEIDDANRIFKSFWDKRAELMGDSKGDESLGTSTGRGSILRQVDLGDNLRLSEVRNLDNQKFGIIDGVLTPHLNEVKGIELAGEDSYQKYAMGGNAWMRWVSFYDADKKSYVTGLKIKPSNVKDLAEHFGRKLGSSHKIETALVDLRAGDRIKIVGSNLAEWELYIGRGGSRESLIVIDNARMKDKDVLMNNGAAYQAIGNFFYVPEAKLTDFLKRFPIQNDLPEGGLAEPQGPAGGATPKSILFQDGNMEGIPLLPPGGYRQKADFQNTSMLMRDAWTDKMQPVLDGLKQEAMNDKTPANLGNMDGFTKSELNKYLRMVKGQMSTHKAVTGRFGESVRDFALLPYHRQYGFDKIFNLGIPYQFFMTRTFWNWAMRVLDRPALLAIYARLSKMANTHENNLPERLRGKMFLPLPFVPKWAGGGTYIDPFYSIFPFRQFTQPLSAYAQDQNYDANNAVYLIQKQEEAGEISPDEAQQAITTRQGPTWEAALAQSEADRSDEKAGAFDYASMLMSPALYASIPYYLLSQKKLGKYGWPSGNLPITRFGNGIETAFQGTGLEWVAKGIGGMLSLPEEKAREKLGLPEFGEFTVYYVERQIANLVGEGKYTSQQGIQAMIEKSGPAYDEAYQRVQQELMLKVPGEMALDRLAKGDLGGLALSLLPSLFPNGLLPQAELEFRGQKEEYNRAWKLYKMGKTDALKQFYEDYPEYSARLSLRDEPEERMRNYLVTEIWESYHELDRYSRKAMVDQLGPEFEQAFMTDAPDYESIPIDQLATWATQIGGVAPKSPEGLVSPEVEKVKPMEKPEADFSKKVTEYMDTRDSNYPKWFTEQQGYYALPAGSARKTYLLSHPDLKKYWDWKQRYFDRYPEVALAMQQQAYQNVDLAKFHPLLVKQILMYGMAGQELTSGAEDMLYRAWIEAGRPNKSPQRWLDSVVMPAVMIQSQNQLQGQGQGLTP